MKKKFEDPARIKVQKPIDEQPQGNKFPWGFKCPEYDKRTSVFITAGTDYGHCINQPVGHSPNARGTVDVMPMTSKTMKADYPND